MRCKSLLALRHDWAENGVQINLGLEFQHRNDVFAIDFMGNADDSCIDYVSGVEQDFFNGGWADVDAAANDEIFFFCQ